MVVVLKGAERKMKGKFEKQMKCPKCGAEMQERLGDWYHYWRCPSCGAEK